MLYNVAIIGAGPAGCSAAVTAAARNLSTLVFDTGDFGMALRKSSLIKNYLGLPDVSGEALMNTFVNHMKAGKPELISHKVLNILPMKGHYFLATPGGIYEAETVLLCLGVRHGKALAGEKEFLGKGVSYCATCDGSFYKGKTIGVVTTLPSAWEEIKFLAGLGRQVKVWATYGRPEQGPDNVLWMPGKPLSVEGDGKAAALKTDRGSEPVDGLFILKETDPVEKLLPGLALDGQFIRVDRTMATNLPGVYAAGDCTGLPWQINKAAGEGQVAVLSAASYLANKKD